MNSKDRYKELGEKQFVLDRKAVSLVVRLWWPDAWSEGSTGDELSWWTRNPTAPDPGIMREGAALIGHSWACKTGGHYVRVRVPMEQNTV